MKSQGEGGSLIPALEVIVYTYTVLQVFSVDINMGNGASLLAEASLKLGPAPRPPATTWLPLIGPALPIPHLGELMFSLSYLPTAERLTLVVVKARNLKGGNPLPGDTFVKVGYKRTKIKDISLKIFSYALAI